MDEMNEMEFANVVTLIDENGDEVEFEALDYIEYEDGLYAVLLPLDDEDSGDVVILEVVDGEDEDEEEYESVEDEDTLNAVFQIFKEKFKDEFNFGD